MPDPSYPGSMKSFCCALQQWHFHWEWPCELDALCCYSFLLIYSWSLCHWSILRQWNPVISFCYCSDSLFMDCKCKIVDLLIGSSPLIVGMNHFLWHMFYTKFPSITVSLTVQLSKHYYSWLWEIKYCSYFPAAEPSNPFLDNTTFLVYISLFLLFRGHCYTICMG